MGACCRAVRTAWPQQLLMILAVFCDPSSPCLHLGGCALRCTLTPPATKTRRVGGGRYAVNLRSPRGAPPGRPGCLSICRWTSTARKSFGAYASPRLPPVIVGVSDGCLLSELKADAWPGGIDDAAA